MKIITEHTISEMVKSIYSNEDNFVDLLDRHTFEQIQKSSDLLFYNICGISYDGFWAWTSGGVNVNLSVDVSFLIGTGHYNSETKIGKWIIEQENNANNSAIREIGERTTENENEYFELVDSYLDGITVDFEISYFLLKLNDFNYDEKIGKNGKPYVTNRVSINNEIIETSYLHTKNLKGFIDKTMISNAKLINNNL